MSVLTESLLWCVSSPTIFNNQVQPVSADGEASGSCTSAPSVALGPSVGPRSPRLPPLAPPALPPSLWILVPSLTLSVALLVSYFPRRSSVCRGGCLGKQTSEKVLGEPDGMLRVSVCLG